MRNIRRIKERNLVTIGKGSISVKIKKEKLEFGDKI